MDIPTHIPNIQTTESHWVQGTYLLKSVFSSECLLVYTNNLLYVYEHISYWSTLENLWTSCIPKMISLRKWNIFVFFSISPGLASCYCWVVWMNYACGKEQRFLKYSSHPSALTALTFDAIFLAPINHKNIMIIPTCQSDRPARPARDEQLCTKSSLEWIYICSCTIQN